MIVACSVNTLFKVNLIVGTFLGIITDDIPLTLLSDDVTDDTLLTIEVVAYLVSFIRCLPLREDRLSLHRTQRILATVGKDSSAVNVHGNDIGCQFYLLIGYLSFAIKVGKAILGKDNGVSGFEIDGSCDGFLTFGYTIGSQRVGSDGVKSQRINHQRVGD